MSRADETPRIETLETSDGVRLAVHRLGEAGATPVVLLAGTFSNHTYWLGTRGRGFARALARRGFEAWVLDFRGHGASQQPAPGQRWSFDDWARRDTPAAVLAAAASGRRVALMGHSAGGAAAATAAAADALVRASTFALVLAATPLPFHLRWARGAAARLIHAVSSRREKFPSRVLGLGPEDELAGVLVEWMNWNLEGHWRGRDGTDYDAALARFRAPVLALVGASDRLWAPPEACRTLLERVGSSTRDFLLCGRATGFSRDFGHVDLLASRAAEAEVWGRVIDWLVRQLAAAGGGAEQRP
jgi:oxygen-independent coproporphyrinogen-3 oxidase